MIFVCTGEIGFIFDLDGTLLDDVPLFLSLPDKLALAYGIQLSDQIKEQLLQEMFKRLSTQSSKMLVIRLILKLGKMIGIPWYNRFGMLRKVQKIYRVELPRCPLVAGCENTIEWAKELGPIGILTTSSMKEIGERFLGREEFLLPFENFVLGRNKVKFMKPSPEGIHILLKRWNLSAEKVIMIGDMTIDIQAGKRAGCRTVGVLTGFGVEEELINAGAEWIIPSIADLPQILPEIRSSFAR